MKTKITRKGDDFDLAFESEASGSSIRKWMWSILLWLGIAILIGWLWPDATKAMLRKMVAAARRAKQSYWPKLSAKWQSLVDTLITWSNTGIEYTIMIIWVGALTTLVVFVIYLFSLASGSKLLISLSGLLFSLWGLTLLTPLKAARWALEKYTDRPERWINSLKTGILVPMAVGIVALTLPVGRIPAATLLGLLVIGMFFVVLGIGNIAKKLATAAVVIGIVFQFLSNVVPAVATGAIGGWPGYGAAKVMVWDTQARKAINILLSERKVVERYTYGTTVDTVRTIILKRGNAEVNPETDKVSYTILPNVTLEIIAEIDSFEWSRDYWIPVKLVRPRGADRVDDFIKDNSASRFYIPWEAVRADESITPYAAKVPTPPQDEAPADFSLTGVVNGRRVGGSVSIRDTVGTLDEEGWTTVVYSATKNPVIRIPLKTRSGDIVEFEYLDGTVAHSRLPDGSQDPKYRDRNGYHYAHDVGPGGYEPDQTMGQSWQLAQTQLLSQGAPYMSLQVGTSPSNVDLRTVFAYGESYATVEVAKPGSYLYLAFNDAFYDKNWSGSVATYVQSQCNRRIGWIKFRVRVAPAYDAESGEEYEELGYASRRR